MRLNGSSVAPLLLLVLTGVSLSACGTTQVEPTPPAATPDLQPTVEAREDQRLEKARQQDAARAETQRLIADLLTPAPTSPPAAAVPAPLLAETPPPMPEMGLESGGFVDPEGRFRLSWWPEGWKEDTRFGQELLSDSPSPFVPKVVFFGGNPIPGGYNPNLTVIRLPVPASTELSALVEQELDQLERAYPGIRVVDRRTTSLHGIPAELIDTVHNGDSIQFFYLILLKDSHEWFVQCTLVMGEKWQEQVCRSVLDGFGFTEAPVLR